jgi:hypothetical protein
VARDRLFPLALLIAYGLAFGAAALGATPLAFDDHPGQLFRVWHVVARGPAPWAWNPDWWTGYPELQFYPPGFAYAGALLHWASLTAMSVPVAYHTLVWIAYLAPGLTAFAALTRILGNGWLALPGAFLALTLSAGPASGVEGGVHVGMVGARLAWASIPLLLALLVPWIDGEARRLPWSAAPLVAATLLLHPAALPTALIVIGLSALARPPRTARLGQMLGVLVVAAALTAFWTVPLVIRIEHTRALAWGEAPRVTAVAVALGLLSLVGLARGGSRKSAVVVALFPWAMAVVTLVDLFVVEPLGLRFLPANRVVDGVWIALVLAAGLGWSRAFGPRGGASAVPPAGAGPRVRHRELLVGMGGVALMVAVQPLAGALALWPRAADWPSLASVERGLRLGDLWTTLRDAPPGRVLFVRSAAPLAYGTEWYRPHTHATALAPLFSGRAIVHGTFTHPSPTAALLYRGDAGRGAITRLAEQLDGRELFGRELGALDAPTFNAYAARLGVGLVVALDEDAPRLRGLDDNPVFARRPAPPPFLVYGSRGGMEIPRAIAPDRLAVTLATDRDAWVSARIAYYPLWRANAQGEPVETRRGSLGDLEVRLGPGARTVELAYGAGAPEIAGTITSAIGILACLALSWRRARSLTRTLVSSQEDRRAS